MARRRTSKPKTIQPAEMTIGFVVPPGDQTIDVSASASVVNRRFYRQILDWAIGNLRFVNTVDNSGSVNVATIQDTWVAKNAIVKSYHMWQELEQMALDDNQSIKPKYHDFKVFLDNDHYVSYAASVALGENGFQTAANPTVGVLTPFTHLAAPGDSREWDYSQVTIPEPTAVAPDAVGNYFLQVHGADTAAAKAIIEGYADTRALPQAADPNVPAGFSTSWMTNLFNQGTLQTETVANRLEFDNDSAPYDNPSYPGGSTIAPIPTTVFLGDFVPGNTTGRIQQFNTGSFNAKCGLIRINNNTENPMLVYMTLVPGTHRGYLAEELV